MSRRNRTPSVLVVRSRRCCRLLGAAARGLRRDRATSTACSRTRSTSRSSSTPTARRGSSTTGRRSPACPPTSALQLRRDDGRHGEGALPDHRGEPDRVSRLRLRARVGESDDRRRQQHGHAGADVYKINSHFDIKREYNPGTGEETNVISENDEGPALEPAPVHARRLVAEPGGSRGGDRIRPSAARRRQRSQHAASRSREGGRSACSIPDRPIMQRATTSTSRTSRSARPTSGLLHAVRRRRRGRAVGLRQRRDHLPQLVAARSGPSEYEPLVVPRPPGDHRHRRDAAAHGVRRRATSSPATQPSLAAEGLTRRRLHRGGAGSVRQVRLLPHRAAHLRPAGRLDAGGAPVLREPLEHLAGDDPEGSGRHSRCSDAQGDAGARSTSSTARRGRSPTT